MSEDSIMMLPIGTGGESKSTTFIDESNLYQLMLRCNKPETMEFRSWLSEELLPRMHNSGFFDLSQMHVADERKRVDFIGKMWGGLGWKKAADPTG